MAERGEAEPRAVLVCRVTPDDWKSYREIRLAALADSPEAFSSTLEREAEFSEQTWRQRLGESPSFLAWHDGAAAGTVTALSGEIAGMPDFPSAWHLVAMWVRPTARGLGIGRLLVQTVIDQAATAGAPSVLLWVFDANERAKALYERMGFRGTERTDARPGNPQDVEYLMIRELSES
jgi:ribosomal protein S18 acetylase RimI-like enzyme